MKNIVVCIGNGLLSEAIIKMLQNSGEFKPFRVLIQKKSNIVVHPEGKISVTLKGGFRGEETI